MPSFKYDPESESEDEFQQNAYAPEPSDDGELGPDDTFHFRQSFSKGTQRGYGQHFKHAPPVDEEDMNEASYQTLGYDDEEEEEDGPYDEEMEEEFISEEGEDQSAFSELESELQDLEDPLATAVRIEKRPTWLEQIEYTDKAIKRLKTIEQRERLVNSKVHWGGQLPDVKYTTEDLERDLFGDTVKVVSYLKELIVVEEKDRTGLFICRRIEARDFRSENLGSQRIREN